MKKIIILVILLIAFFVTGRMDEKSRPNSAKVSPFTAVSFEDETIRVEFQNAPYDLVSIEGITSTDLIAAAKKRFGRKWQKRIREDIVDVLKAAGVDEDRHVDLKLQDHKTGLTKSVSDAKMTEANRSKIYNAEKSDK